MGSITSLDSREDARTAGLLPQAVKARDALGELKGKATTLANAAGILLSMGDGACALKLWERAMELQKKVGDDKGRALALSNMGTVVAQQGNLSRAALLWEQALALFEQLGDEEGKTRTLANMDRFMARQDERRGAIRPPAQTLEPWEWDDEQG